MTRLRTVLIALAAVLAVLVPAAPGQAHGRDSTGRFTLGATVLDGGEQVTSVSIDTGRLGPIRAGSLSATTFSVRAVGRIPDGVDPGAQPVQVFDEVRTVSAASLTTGGRITLDLVSGPTVAGASTLTYMGVQGRNVMLDLTYTITQNTPLTLKNGRSATITSFRQGALVDPEVDRFSAAVSRQGLNYRLAKPTTGRGERPLIVWLHGNGEGGFEGYYDNEVQLRANRGALGPATVEAQAVFGGAYVVAPQVPDTWYDADANGYQAKLRALIREVSAKNRIDQRRIYVLGASAGGLMSVKLTAAYPDDVAALVPTCPAFFLNRTGAYTITAEEIQRVGDVPTWFVQSKDDATVPYEKAAAWGHELLPGSLLTLYPNVSWSGVSYNGHFSWIYTARNAPTTDSGVSLWTWIAQQRS